MPKPLYVRELMAEEREQLRAGLRSSSAFTVRRSQILLMNSEERLTARQIAARLRCSDQCVREALHAFEQEGVGCLQAKSHRKHHLPTKFSPTGLERLAGLVHQSPRQYGMPPACGRWHSWRQSVSKKGSAAKQSATRRRDKR
jgi:hypothetical protein